MIDKGCTRVEHRIDRSIPESVQAFCFKEADVLRALDGAGDEGHAVEDNGQEKEDGKATGKLAAVIERRRE